MSQSAAPGRLGGTPLVLGILILVGAMAGGAWWWSGQSGRGGDANAAFANAMATGGTLYERGDASKSIEAFQRALVLNPANPDVHLNLANAHLRAGQPTQSEGHAREVLRYEPGNAAAAYVLGCALLRQNQYSNAVQSLTEAKNVDPTENPVSFQLGRAYLGWGKYEDAAAQFQEVIQFETNHTSAHYLLSQALLRLGQRDAAQQALQEHQRINTGKVGGADDPTLFERSKYTAIRVPFSLEQPTEQGVPVKFVDATAQAFGAEASSLQGPIGLLDINRRGWNDLLLVGPEGAQVLWNSNGVFTSMSPPLPLGDTNAPRQILIGDLQNDRFEDAVLISPAGLTVLRFATNGNFTDATPFSGLAQAKAAGVAGALADLDFTGKLGLLLSTPNGTFRSFTNLGSGLFRERKSAGPGPDPLAITDVTQITVDDLTNDDLPDVLLTRSNLPPFLLINQRGGGLSTTNQPAGWSPARAVATGDFNNDLRADVALVTPSAVEIHFSTLREPRRLPARGNQIQRVRAVDYDNDGWLDVVAWGRDGLWVWRNRGSAGFHFVTTELGLDPLKSSAISDLAVADFDQDGDLDLIAANEAGGLRFLRNDGGNANGLLKLRLLGNRSNASALGVKIELASGGWHTIRTVQQLPVEIGVGQRKQLDLVSTRWFDTKLDTTEVVPDSKEALTIFELVMPTGSCPYLYAWDGTEFRFITDLLGAAPVGLPVAPGRYIEADPEEWAWVGNSRTFPAKSGEHVLEITEELREILYLDQARLVAVDHPADTEIHPTSKLVPGRPFPPHRLLQVGGRIPLRQAQLEANGVTRDVTTSLRDNDGTKVSPPQLRGSHYRGLAEPYSVVLDFGPLPKDGPLMLALSGWLRFGGGMANIAGSHQPEFPFPFPVLEAETAQGWQKLNLTVGAPAGKTKTILVDLTGQLPPDTRRLRLTQAFEIHWDRAALFTQVAPAVEQELPLTQSELRWRGYSEFANLLWTEPLSPIYSQVRSNPPWRITPSGWATRYGSVDELITQADDGLAIIAGGDALSLKFAARPSPPPAGQERDYFLFTIGWDKDADYHVAAGTTITPLPWRGMDDQRHGIELRPAFPSDVLHERYNTRWVGPLTYARKP
ncbi:MAG: VCBS repeat-containing protein [Verrucomicrobia bacterium]|nr:VCBS repeat-containing protein [Verrucomicrobiota bacterium]